MLISCGELINPFLHSANLPAFNFPLFRSRFDSALNFTFRLNIDNRPFFIDIVR